MEYDTLEIPPDISSLQQKNISMTSPVEDSDAVGLNDFTALSESSPRFRKMYVAALSALLFAAAAGMPMGYTAVATYDMITRNSSPIKPTEDEITWIGSVLALGLMCGALLAGPAADRFGRKTILMVNTIPFVIGWLTISFAKNIATVIVGRLLTGVACGVAAVVVPVYCVEISTTEVRGLLGSSLHGFSGIGNLLGVLVGAYISWEYLALFCACVPTFALLCFYSMPESPRWLLSQNDVGGAMKVMRYLQGGNMNVKEECERIYRDLQIQPKGILTLRECKHPSIYKPTIICLILFFFHQFSGAGSVLFYSSEIFAGSNFLDPKKSTVILGAVQVVSLLLSNAIVDKTGRKSLLLISGTFMSLSLATLGIYFYKSSEDTLFKSHFNWIPLLCLVSFLISFSLGFAAIPALLAAEMLPLRARSTISGMIMFTNGLCAFAITKTFNELEDLIYNYGTFWTYSSLTVMGCVFILLVLPETKGKELSEISNYFCKSTNKDQELSVSVVSK